MKPSRMRSFSVLFSSLLAMLLAGPAASQIHKVSAELPRTLIGGVESFRLSPDGVWVVYRSDDTTDDVFELHSVPVVGGQAPLDLSDALVSGGDVSGGQGGFQVGPDSSFVVYVADQETDDVSELFLVAIDGSGAPQKRSGTLVAGGDVADFRISPDGSRIVYRADQDQDEVLELYSVPSDGSAAPVKLSTTPVAGGDVLDYALSAGNGWVVYLADQDSDQRNELYAVPLDGSAPAQRLNEPLDAGENVDAFRIAPDESRVAYHADQNTNDVFELFSAPIDGSAAPVRLSGTLASGGDVQDFEIDSASSRVVYRADQDTNNVVELYSAPLDGSQAALRLYATSRESGTFRIRTTAAEVLFLAELDTLGVFQLYSVPLAGGSSPVRLHPAIGSTQDVVTLSIASDDQHALYTLESAQFGPYGSELPPIYDLYSVLLGGGAAIKLNHAAAISIQETVGVSTPAGANVLYRLDDGFGGLGGFFSVPIDGSLPPVKVTEDFDYLVTPDDGRIVFRGSEGPQAPFVLRSATLRGDNPVTLSEPPLLGGIVGDVLSYQITPDSVQLVYLVSSPGNLYLYVASPGGPVLPRLVSNPFGEFGDLLSGSTAISPDSKRLAFLRQDPVTSKQILYSVPLRGGPPAVKLDPTHNVYSEFSVQPRFTPDGKSIVYAARTPGPHPYLYIVPADGSESPLELSSLSGTHELWLNSMRAGVRLDPAGERVVYSANPNGRFEIFSVPLDRSSEPVRLNGALPVGANAYGNFLITPDGSRVLYIAGQEVASRPELYSAPIDGSSPAIKLNGLLVSGGGVGASDATADIEAHVQVSPDGAQVVYRADQLTDGTYELFLVPTDASAPPVRISGPLVANGDVQSYFAISPDGSHVVYVADADTDAVIELYSAPLGLSTPPVRISGALVSGGNVLADGSGVPFVFAGERVLYHADQDTNDVAELYSAALDGSTPAIRISGTLPATGDVVPGSAFADAAHGLAYYRADADQDEVFELYRVPLDGSSAPVKISGALPSGGDVQSGAGLAAGGRAVLYRADQDADNVFELYANQPPHDPRGPAHGPGISGSFTRPK